MKVYHVLIVTVIVVGFMIAMTNYNNGAGLLNDLTTYNSDINVSKFSAFDQRSSIDSQVSTMKDDVEVDSVTTDDTEQNILKKLWGGTRNLATTFVTSYTLLHTAEDELNIPSIVFWVITTILSIFLFTKLIGRFFLDR